MRQIVLDTETTGLEPSQGHRIIEIGCVEMIDRRVTGSHYHQYINPEREVDAGALEVHGISQEFLADKPRFQEVAEEFIHFIRGAELVIHNAPFDVGFIDHELKMLGPQWGKLSDYCTVVDSLQMARKLHPGQKNNLDALCRRYEIDNAHRELHGALLDSEILADVYLAMTGGQVSLLLDGQQSANDAGGAAAESIRRLAEGRPALRVRRADEAEMAAHEERMQAIDKACGGEAIWRH